MINNIGENKTRNVRYNEGPDRTEVERRVGKTFTPIAIKENNKPGQNLRKDQLEIYRPQLQKNISAERKPAPSKVVSWKNVKPAEERKVKKQQTKEQPTRQQPTIEQPVRQQPAKEQPTKKQPSKPKQDTPQKVKD